MHSYQEYNKFDDPHMQRYLQRKSQQLYQKRDSNFNIRKRYDTQQ